MATTQQRDKAFADSADFPLAVWVVHVEDGDAQEAVVFQTEEGAQRWLVSWLAEVHDAEVGEGDLPGNTGTLQEAVAWWQEQGGIASATKTVLQD